MSFINLALIIPRRLIDYHQFSDVANSTDRGDVEADSCGAE